jgi:hypothetical protein
MRAETGTWNEELSNLVSYSSPTSNPLMAVEYARSAAIMVAYGTRRNPYL